MARGGVEEASIHHAGRLVVGKAFRHTVGRAVDRVEELPVGKIKDSMCDGADTCETGMCCGEIAVAGPGGSTVSLEGGVQPHRSRLGVWTCGVDGIYAVGEIVGGPVAAVYDTETKVDGCGAKGRDGTVYGGKRCEEGCLQPWSLHGLAGIVVIDCNLVIKSDTANS